MRVKERERERETAFVTAETTVFVTERPGDTRATNVKQTKARGTSMYAQHTAKYINIYIYINKCMYIQTHTLSQMAPGKSEIIR